MFQGGPGPRRLEPGQLAAFCERLIHNSRSLWRKDQCFRTAIAVVNLLVFNKTMISQTPYLRKALKLSSATESCYSHVTIRELDTTIRAMRSKGNFGASTQNSARFASARIKFSALPTRPHSSSTRLVYLEGVGSRPYFYGWRDY